MTSPTYVRLRNAIEHIIKASQPLISDPKGTHYFNPPGTATTAPYSYLVRLGILGPKQRFRSSEFDQKVYGRNVLEVVHPVNYERLEKAWDKLIKIGENEGMTNEIWNKEKYYRNNKLRKLRVDLEELK
jgi:hypothetical protein